MTEIPRNDFRLRNDAHVTTINLVMSLSVKLFVKSADSDDVQIRRFAVDEDVSACYEYLTAKIRATVPGAGDAALKLFWKGRSQLQLTMYLENVPLIIIP